MSHFTNVQAILKAMEERELEPIVSVLDAGKYKEEYGDWDDWLEEFVRSLLFVLVSLKASILPVTWKELKERLTDATIDEEIDEMFWEDQDYE